MEGSSEYKLEEYLRFSYSWEPSWKVKSGVCQHQGSAIALPETEHFQAVLLSPKVVPLTVSAIAVPWCEMGMKVPCAALTGWAATTEELRRLVLDGF